VWSIAAQAELAHTSTEIFPASPDEQESFDGDEISAGTATPWKKNQSLL